MERNKIRELILEYPDGDITELERQLVEKHLRSSPESREFFDRSQRLWALMDEWEEIEASSDYVSRFWQRVAIEEGKAYSRLVHLLSSFKFPLGAAAMLTVVLLVTVISLDHFEGKISKNNITPPTETLSEVDLTENKLLEEVDTTISTEPTQVLEIYGPWGEFREFETGGIQQSESSVNTLIRSADYGSIY